MTRVGNKPNTLFRELPGWTLRGLLCALPSFFWAYLGGFNALIEISAMFVGIAFYVYAFAWFSADRAEMTRSRIEWVSALKMAVVSSSRGVTIKEGEMPRSIQLLNVRAFAV